MARTSARGLSLRRACIQGLCVIRRVIDHLTEKVETRLTDVSHLNDRYWPKTAVRFWLSWIDRMTALEKSCH
jgi:hypothetical protein